MKKGVVLSLLILLALPLGVYAASIGGVETQGQGKFSIGLDQEFLFDRDMEKESLGWTESIAGSTVIIAGTDKTEADKMYRTMVKASYGILDNLDIFVKLGTADAEYKTKSSGTWEVVGVTSGTWEEIDKVKTDNAFAYGVGLKGTYNLENDWFIGCEAQYLRHRHDAKVSGSFRLYDNTGALWYSEDFEPWKVKITVQEWQVAPYIAKKLGNFVPYLGVKYSDQRVNIKSEGERYKYKAEDNCGVFVGTDYKVSENLSLNLEGRFVDETAVSFGATYKF